MVVGLLDFTWSRFVNEDVVSFLAGVANERKLAERLFHHPFEVAIQETINEKNVERALVVGHKNIALTTLKLFAAIYVYGEK